MHYLENFYIKNLKYDLINKFFYTNTKKLPKIKKIVLNFGCKTTNIKIIATNLLALELISGKKGVLKTSRQPNLVLKIKKGNPTGCALTLIKKFQIKFIYKILIEILTKIKQFDGFTFKSEKNCFSYTIKNSFHFSCFKDHYYLFNNLSNLNITIITDNFRKEETIFILKSLQFPIK